MEPCYSGQSSAQSEQRGRPDRGRASAVRGRPWRQRSWVPSGCGGQWSAYSPWRTTLQKRYAQRSPPTSRSNHARPAASNAMKRSPPSRPSQAAIRTISEPSILSFALQIAARTTRSKGGAKQSTGTSCIDAKVDGELEVTSAARFVKPWRGLETATIRRGTRGAKGRVGGKHGANGRNACGRIGGHDWGVSMGANEDKHQPRTAARSPSSTISASSPEPVKLGALTRRPIALWSTGSSL